MKKKLEVIQEEISDCGICCLASIIKYYGGSISLETLRFYTSTGVDGTNAYELINCAKRFGFNAIGERCDNLAIIDQPIIAHVKLENDFFHFVVIYKVKKDILYIMDPSLGMNKINIDEFYKIYTGVIIKFNPIALIPKYKKINFLKTKFFEELYKNKYSYILVLLISLFIFVFTMINNLEIKILSFNSSFIYCLFFLVIINELLIYIKNIIVLNNSINFNNKVLIDFINHVFKLPLYYLKLKQKGEISTRFNELNTLTNNIINFIVEIIYLIILSLITITFISILSIKLFLFIIFFTFIYIFINLIIYKKLVNKVRYSINLEESYNSNILDYISNFDTIKHLNIYNYFINNINKNLFKRNKVTKSINKQIFLITTFNNILFGIVLLMVLYFIVINKYDLTNSLVIYSLLCFYINNIKGLVESYPSILIYKTYISKSNEFLSFKEDERILNISNFSNIIIKNLFYKINNNSILKNVNFEIKNKDKIFVNGPSGIGKSTLMKILNNEINGYKGIVLMDGVDIKKYNLNNLITYVSQNETLFNDTVYNNLLLGKKIDENEFNKVLEITKLNNINLIKTSGLNSLIINDNSLSGGEKNRLILARSLIHSKSILILDEVLKEVDINLEKEILKDILEYYSDKTILYTSHKDVGFLFNNVLTFRKEKQNGIRK